MKIFATIIATTLFVQGCATSDQGSGKPVLPGEPFTGIYFTIKAPYSEGWKLIQSSSIGMAFAKGGQKQNESFVAEIAKFNLPATSTPEAFKSLIQAGIEKDTDSNRFNIHSVSFQYTSERNYPCVRYKSIAQDNKPQGSNTPLFFELSAIYCRHPIQQETGFSVTYSHRGEARYNNLHNEAESFIQNVQVPTQ